MIPSANKLRRIIAVSSVIAIIALYLFSDQSTLTSETPSLLQTKSTALLQENKVLNQKLQALEAHQAHLQELILERDGHIYHLKQSLNEKVHRINDFSILELERFFSGFKTDSLYH